MYKKGQKQSIFVGKREKEIIERQSGRSETSVFKSGFCVKPLITVTVSEGEPPHP